MHVHQKFLTCCAHFSASATWLPSRQPLVIHLATQGECVEHTHATFMPEKF